jgi:hypothetical protein
MKIIHIFLTAFTCILFSHVDSYAEVMTYDLISLKDDATMLKAKTGGRFFAKGGKVVEFLINDKSIGKVLSGGDGYAFKEFSPIRSGLYRVSVVSGKDKDNGFLLSLEKGTGIVFVDVEGSILMPLSKEPRKGSQKVIKGISKRFPVIYLQTGIIDTKSLKEWLRKNDFVGAPVLQWKDGEVFREIAEKGFKIKFLIGSPSVIESAKEFKPRAFSFDEVEGAVEVKDWEEIGKKMFKFNIFLNK